MIQQVILIFINGFSANQNQLFYMKNYVWNVYIKHSIDIISIKFVAIRQSIEAKIWAFFSVELLVYIVSHNNIQDIKHNKLHVVPAYIKNKVDEQWTYHNGKFSNISNIKNYGGIFLPLHARYLYQLYVTHTTLT